MRCLVNPPCHRQRRLLRIVQIAVCVAIAFVSVDLFAETNYPEPSPLNTDRPGFGNSTAKVPTGSLQTELGTDFSRISNTSRLNTLSALVRGGISDLAEIRLEGQAATLVWAEETSQSRALPSVGLSTKLSGIISEDLSVGIVPRINLLRNENSTVWTGDAMGTISYAGLPIVSIDANIAAETSLENSNSTLYSGSLSVGFELGENASGFVEAFGTKNGNAELSFDAGATYLLTPLLQLDGYVGINASTGDHYFGGLGLSFRTDFVQPAE